MLAASSPFPCDSILLWIGFPLCRPRWELEQVEAWESAHPQELQAAQQHEQQQQQQQDSEQGNGRATAAPSRGGGAGVAGPAQTSSWPDRAQAVVQAQHAC